MKQDTSTRHGASFLWILTLSLLACWPSSGDDSAGRSASTRETLIRISTEKEGPLTHLFVENVQLAQVTVTFEMELQNLTGNVEFPCTTTLPGKKKAKLFTLSPVDATRGWSWTYTYYSTFGGIDAEHDNSCVYSLPYAPGKSYRVSQGHNGNYSHFGSDQYAIDWRMPLGTPIHAARGGTVVGVKSDSNVGGDSSKYDWDANYILIEHPDGTLGQYVHLMKGGCRVKLGDKVEAGDFIGLSGNTGHSTGPHLHFSVFKAKDGKNRQTIPVRYRTADGYAVTLAEGRSYKAAGTSSMLAGTSSTAPSIGGRAVGSAPAKEMEGLGGAIGKAVGR